MYKLILSVLVVLCFKITLSQDSKRNQIRDRIDACLEGTIHQNFIIKTQRHGYYIVTKETDLLENTCNPKVAIYRKDSGYQLKINGIKPSIICEKPEVVYENEIDGEFEGWDGDTVFKMVDGQVYQQLNHDYF
jgi:hypothetical protein